MPADIIALLKTLTTDPSTVVYLLSGRGITDLEGVSAAVPKLGIVAEHGCFVKPHGGEEKRDWVSSLGNLDMSWRVPCVEILTYVSPPLTFARPSSNLLTLFSFRSLDSVL